jgi:hypothetical protein
LVRTIACTLILMAGCAFGQTGRSKGPLSPAGQTAAIEAVREYALSYTRHLPDYTCTQTTHQVTSLGQPQKVLSNTVTEEQLSFVDGKEVRRIMRIDGLPPSAEAAGHPAGMSRGEFGNFLDVIFEPSTAADLRWDRAATLNKRKVDVLSFHVPRTPGYTLSGSRGTVQVPFEGFVYADAETHAVLRIQMKCTGIPDNSQYQAVDLTLDYKPAQVAGQEFILPSHYVLNLRTPAFNAANEAEFTAYRRFSANATIQFGADSVQER